MWTYKIKAKKKKNQNKTIFLAQWIQKMSLNILYVINGQHMQTTDFVPGPLLSALQATLYVISFTTLWNRHHNQEWWSWAYRN